MHARIFGNMISDLRGTSTYMKSKIKKVTRDHEGGWSSPSHADAFRDAVRPLAAAVTEAQTGEAFMQLPAVRAVPVFPGLPLGVVDDSLTPTDRVALRKYVFILFALSQTDDQEGVLKEYKRIQTGGTDDDAGKEESTLSPTLTKAMLLLSECFAATAGPAGGGDAAASSAEQLLHNTKIGQLAKEISSEVDFSQLNVSKPEDLLNVNNLLGADGPLSSMIGQVSSKIQQKLQTGELKHEELLSEAMGLLKTFDAGGALGGMLNPDLLRLAAPLMSGQRPPGTSGIQRK